MRVLTVRQPWAWAIVHGGKTVHAGLSYDYTWRSTPLARAVQKTEVGIATSPRKGLQWER